MMLLAQVKRSCLMVARRRRMMMMRFDYNNNNNNCYIHTTPPTSFSRHLQFSSHTHTFNSIGGGGGGLRYEWRANHRVCICMYYHSKRGGECDFEKEYMIKQGDDVDISELLFTKHRDYLIRYNDPKPVTAEELAGKIIVIYFLPFHYHVDINPPDRLFKESLIDTYNDLKFNNCFEVVMVVDEVTSFDGGESRQDLTLQGKFEDIVSKFPSWPAIPFSDIESRKRLKGRFGHLGQLLSPQMVLIDSTTGLVLDTLSQKLFQTYGSEAYPFSDQRIAILKAKDKMAFSQHSLKELLGSPERDFVISNKGEEIPIQTLEDKVVALYFYEEDCLMPDSLTRKLMMYYNELKTKSQNFELVLLYLYDTCKTTCSTKEKFQKTFETMPWLALPFKDPVLKKLKRLFGYPDEEGYYNAGPSLVIVGPRKNVIGCGDIIEPGPASIMRGCGDIIEPGPANIMREYDGNLFLPEEFAKVEGDRVRELKLEMLCSPNTVFKSNDGSQVQFSQLAGKRIIFLFEGDYPEYDGEYFRDMLKSVYRHAKGTANEFEVVYFPNNKDINGKRVADMPWLMSCPVELLPGGSAFLSFYGNSYNRYHSSLLLAFGRDGSLVRRAICPWFGDYHFPFYSDDVASEAFDIENSDFCWGYWDTLYQGVLKGKSRINFLSANHLFCVYYYTADTY